MAIHRHRMNIMDGGLMNFVPRIAVSEGLIGTDTVTKSTARSLSEGLIGTDTVTKILIAIIVLTEGWIGTDTIKVLLNGTDVIWTRMVKAANAVWTKITKN